jgi:hypothetical protein
VFVASTLDSFMSAKRGRPKSNDLAPVSDVRRLLAGAPWWLQASCFRSRIYSLKRAAFVNAPDFWEWQLQCLVMPPRNK